jgi:hypothetical protein
MGNMRGPEAMPDALYYGDNLDVPRGSIAGESVDPVHLDPPFNSQASYNVLFKGPSGKGAGNTNRLHVAQPILRTAAV